MSVLIFLLMARLAPARRIRPSQSADAQTLGKLKSHKHALHRVILSSTGETRDRLTSRIGGNAPRKRQIESPVHVLKFLRICSSSATLTALTVKIVYILADIFLSGD
jgi:hypothetical protein